MVGAGQLARMTLAAATALDVPVRLLAARHDDGAARVWPSVRIGEPDDPEALGALVDETDVVTFDHELVDLDLIAKLAADGATFRPPLRTIQFTTDKLRQREELGDIGVPLPPWRRVSSTSDLEDFAADHGWPLVLKAARGGYDGRGVWMVDDSAAGRSVLDEAAQRGLRLFAEPLVELRRELAVLIARRADGEQVTYGPIATVQVEGQLAELVVPVPDAPTDAVGLAIEIADHIEAVGILAVELFDTPDGLLLNELAARPHNSGHWTIEGSTTSQFANHLRAVLDWPLGVADQVAPAVVTVNVLGRADGFDPGHGLVEALAVPGVAAHLYGKSARPGRKLGHVTALGEDVEEARERARAAAAALGEPLREGTA